MPAGPLVFQSGDQQVIEYFSEETSRSFSISTRRPAGHRVFQ